MVGLCWCVRFNCGFLGDAAMAVTPQKPLHDSIAAGLAVQKAHAFDAKESFATLKSMLLKVGFWFHLQGLLIFGSLEVLAC